MREISTEARRIYSGIYILQNKDRDTAKRRQEFDIKQKPKITLVLLPNVCDINHGVVN